MMTKEQSMKINKCLGAVGYLLNNWHDAAKHTSFSKFGLKFRSNELLKEVEKLEKALTETNKDLPTYSDSMEQLHSANLVYDSCMNAAYELSNKDIIKFNEFVVEKFNELKKNSNS